jgi:hypothetical protein
MRPMSGFPRVLTVTVIAALFGVAFLGLVLGHSLPRNLHPSRDEQCEPLATDKDPNAVVLEPQNTWSNWGYWIAGTIILFRSRNLLGAVVGLNLCFEFLFSGLYHSKLTDSMQFIDVAWIYVLLLTLIACAVQCVVIGLHDPARETELPSFTIIRTDGTRGGNWSLLVALTVAAASIGIGLVIRVIRPLLPPILSNSTVTTIFLAAILAIVLLGQYLWYGLFWVLSRFIPRIFPPSPLPFAWSVADILDPFLIVVFGLGSLLFRFSDGDSPPLFNWCSRNEGALQPHAVWHILSAVLVLVTYDFFCHYFPEQGRVFASWRDD